MGKHFSGPEKCFSTFGGLVRLRYGSYVNASVGYRLGIVRYRLVFASARLCGKLLLKRPWAKQFQHILYSYCIIDVVCGGVELNLGRFTTTTARTIGSWSLNIVS